MLPDFILPKSSVKPTSFSFLFFLQEFSIVLIVCFFSFFPPFSF